MKKNCKNSGISFNSNPIQNTNNTNTDNMFDFDHPDLTDINVPGRNAKVLEDFYNRYSKYMYAVARNAGYDYHTAGLAIDDILIRLSTKGCDFEPMRGKFRSYLAKAVRNACFNVKRKWNKEFAFAPEELAPIFEQEGSVSSPAMFVQREEHKQIMLDALDRLWTMGLDPRKVRAFRMVFWEQERPKDVAKTLHMTPQEVYQATFTIMRDYYRPLFKDMNDAG